MRRPVFGHLLVAFYLSSALRGFCAPACVASRGAAVLTRKIRMTAQFRVAATSSVRTARVALMPRVAQRAFAADLSKPKHAEIAKQIKAKDIVLYMKGTPDHPQCGFSGGMVQILAAEGVEYDAHNVLADEELRNEIKEFSDWPTIPQLYVRGEFIGGFDIVKTQVSCFAID